MRYDASEKLEIIRLVEQSVRQVLGKTGFGRVPVSLRTFKTEDGHEGERA